MQQRQLTLFDNQVLDLEPLIKSALHNAARESRLSREQLVDRANAIAARSGVRLNKNAKKLSLEVLEKWLNPADRDHMPSLNALQVLMLALENQDPLRVLARAMGAELLSAQEAKLLQAAKLEREIKQLQQQKKRLEAQL